MKASKKIMATILVPIMLFIAPLTGAQNLPAVQSFDQADGVLARARAYGQDGTDWYKTWMLGDLEKVE